jgi:pimeloyl-ACP methyl ester carboxylesterase
MSKNTTEATTGDLPATTMESFYFAAGDHSLFAWLHEPTGPQASVGVVVCKPFGFEALCGHSSMRKFAEAAAGLGIPALRFDYLGTGDSPEIEPRADQIDIWTRDIVAAAAELRRRTGVERVCLVGIRLGALLAARAARDIGGIAGLFAVAPVINGKRYLTELRTTRLAALMGVPPITADNRFGGDFEAANPGLMEFTGYPLSAASIAALAPLKLSAADTSADTEWFIVDRADLPGAKEFNESLVSAGVPAQRVALPGFVEMCLVSPQYAVVPQPMVQALREFLQGLVGGPALPAGELPRVPKSAIRGDGTAAVSLRGDAPDSNLTERPVWFGTEAAQLFGIVTEPAPGDSNRRAVFFPNTGTDFHMGASRMYVSLARAWARRGYVVLRMDFAGIGDSGTRSGRPDNDLFPPAALDDMRAGIRFIRDRYGIEELTLCGLCSGGYHSLRAAAAGMDVQRILMVNPQNYFWKDGAPLDEGMHVSEAVRNPGIYRQRLGSLQAWKRLLTGEVSLWRIARVYTVRSLLSLELILRDVARYLRIRLPQDLGWELEDIVRRGTHIAFVFSKGELGISLLKLQAGLSLKRLGDRCPVHIIDGADHTFSRSAARSLMARALTQELIAGPPAGSGVVDTANCAAGEASGFQKFHLFPGIVHAKSASKNALRRTSSSEY